MPNRMVLMEKGQVIWARKIWTKETEGKKKCVARCRRFGERETLSVCGSKYPLRY